MQSIGRITAAVEAQKGSLGKLVYGETLATDIVEVSGNLRQVTDQLKHGRGTMGKLIMDEKLYTSLASFSARADTIMTRATADSSNMSKIIGDPEFYSRISKLLQDLNLLLVDIRENPDRYVNVSVF